LESPA